MLTQVNALYLRTFLKSFRPQNIWLTTEAKPSYVSFDFCLCSHVTHGTNFNDFLSKFFFFPRIIPRCGDKGCQLCLKWHILHAKTEVVFPGSQLPANIDCFGSDFCPKCRTGENLGKETEEPDMISLELYSFPLLSTMWVFL